MLFSAPFFPVSVDKPFKLSTLIYITKLTALVFLLYIDYVVKMCITDSKRVKSTITAKEIPSFHIVIHKKWAKIRKKAELSTMFFSEVVDNS